MRWFLRATLVVGWLLVGALALHESNSPVVLGRWSREFAGLLGLFTGGVAIWTAAVVLHLRNPRALPDFLQSLRARGILVPLIAFSGSFLFTCGVMEVGVRAVDFMGTSMYSEIERYWWDTLPDDELMYRHVPGFESTYQDVPVAYNAMGLRDRELPPRRPDVERLLVLGDSVVFSWGVAEEHMFSRQLETALAEQLGRPVEAVNAGVCSYNTEMQLRQLRRHGDEIDPDAVLLLYVHNDTDPTLMPPRDWGTLDRILEDPVGSLRYVLRKSRIYSVADHIVPAILSPPQLDPSEPGWAASYQALAEMAAWCHERDIPFAVLYYRMTDHNPKHALLKPEIERVSGESGFPLGDTLPWFGDAGPRPYTNSFVDSHPNPAGHQLLAEGTAAWLAPFLAHDSTH